MTKYRYIYILMFLFFLFTITVSALEAKTGAGVEPSDEDTNLPEIPEDASSEQVDAILARLSDEQIRGLLISELKKSIEEVEDGAEEDSLLEELDSESGKISKRLAAVVNNIPNIPADLYRCLDVLKAKKGGTHLVGIVLILVLVFFIGLGVEYIFRRFTNMLRQKVVTVFRMSGMFKIWNAIINFLLNILNIIVFFLSTILMYLLLFGPSKSPSRLLFVACLLTIIISRILIDFSKMLFSPKITELRLMNISDKAAVNMSRNLVKVILICVIAYFFLQLLRILDMPYDSRVIITIAIVTILFIFLAHIILKNRSNVGRTILQGSSIDGVDNNDSWFRNQFANTWHIYAIAYLVLLWLVAASRFVIAVGARSAGAFYLSLLIIPIYLVLDRIGRWLIISTMGIIIKQKSPTSNGVTEEEDEEQKVGKDDFGRYISIAQKILRTGIIFILLVWILDAWNIEIPYIINLGNVLFDIFITLVLAHVAWSISTKVITKKLQESGYESEKDPSAEDDEWGAAEAERSHTLLPLARKFIGSVLISMVIMTIISSIGVNVGPLLAGAGVVGLAIGFGAQKLVSDIFSGFFLLIDDAFRVGEYIQGSGVAGTVEGITLRMVKLRHHRGMLQFVPYSDLGTITNFMRGGMVVKFNLQLPYNTDIDKVRKIIKKVGKKMLQDEQFADDFIKPIKSQGVKSVGDSVMTFRVKFTAKPGKQFMIRREAFRRITEDLAAKGIHYAHRKVIVEIPQEAKDSTEENKESSLGEPPNPEDTIDPKEKALEAGAAAALDTIMKEEEGEAKKKKK